MISFQNDILPLKNELFRLALRITQNRADAEDVVQDTMLKIWKRRDEWPQIDNIEAFCLTMCRNQALDKLRLMDNRWQSTDEGWQSTASPSASVSPSTPVSTSTPETIAIAKSRLQLVRSLIDALPEKQRSCIQLRDIEGKSYRDIATILDITEQQVKVNIFRARQTIKEKFLKIK